MKSDLVNFGNIETHNGLAGVWRDLLRGERLPPGLLPDGLRGLQDPGAHPGHYIPASQQLLYPYRQEGGGDVQENNSAFYQMLSGQGQFSTVQTYSAL